MDEKEYIEREAILKDYQTICNGVECVRCPIRDKGHCKFEAYIRSIPAADVRPVSEIEKIIESLQEQADIYNARAKELLVEEDGQVSQYTWAVSLRETYRRVIKTLDDLIS